MSNSLAYNLPTYVRVRTLDVGMVQIKRLTLVASLINRPIRINSIVCH